VTDDRDRNADALAPEEITRYSRHLTLPEVGLAGQLRLRAARVLVVGAGGLGSPVAMYLAAAGVGRLGLVDFDVVEASNLQRQLLYGSQDVGRPKLERARERIREINPLVEVEVHPVRLRADNALALLDPYDVILDGTDNFATRYLVNDACVLLGKPNVYGSIFRFEGQVSVFWSRRGPCYRCLYPEPPPPGAVPSCAEGGVLGVLPGVIGTLQATEAIKLLLGRGRPLVGRLVLFDALEMRFREVSLRKDPACPACGERATLRELTDTVATCEVDLPRDETGRSVEVEPLALRQRLDGGTPPLLLDVRTPEEWAICRIEGATWIPLQDLPRRTDELDSGREIVVYCHVGARSARAVDYLRSRGFTRVSNLTGGIRAWAATVDPSMPSY